MKNSLKQILLNGAKLPLDGYSSISSAYGLSRLTNDYKGAAILIKRVDGGNNIIDCGFTRRGDFDMATAASFCGSNAGQVLRLYDQSGNNRDAPVGSSGSTAYPQIMSGGGNFYLKNGRPTIRFTGNDTYFQAYKFAYPDNDWGLFKVACPDSYVGNEQNVYGSDGQGHNMEGFYTQYGKSGSIASDASIFGKPNVFQSANVNAPLSNNNLLVSATTFAEKNLTAYLNNNKGSTYLDAVYPVGTFNSFRIGSYIPSYIVPAFAGFWAEHITFSSKVDESRLSQLTVNRLNYYKV
jgi:hypothetical protein